MNPFAAPGAWRDEGVISLLDYAWAKANDDPYHVIATREARTEAVRLPEILASRTRRFCSTCQKRKTYYLILYGHYAQRRCWNCMTESEREAFRDGY